MRGLIRIAGHVPHHRLRREAISEVVGGAPGRTRALASDDGSCGAVVRGRHAAPPRPHQRHGDPRGAATGPHDPVLAEVLGTATATEDALLVLASALEGAGPRPRDDRLLGETR